MKCKIVCCGALVLATWAALAADRSADASLRKIELMGYAIAGGVGWRIIKYRNRAADERNARESFRSHRAILDAEGKLNDSICWFCGSHADGTVRVDDLKRSIPCCSVCGRWVRSRFIGELVSSFAYSALVGVLIYIVLRMGNRNGTSIVSGMEGTVACVGAFVMFCASFRRSSRRHKHVLKRDLDDITKLVESSSDV